MNTGRAPGWVLILGGGAGQRPFIKAVKNLGYQVCVIDRNPNAPGMGIADEQWELSTYDFDLIRKKIISHAVSLGRFVAVIARVSGPALETAAKLNHFLQIPGATIDLVKMCNRKSETRTFCKKNCIPVPDGDSYEKHDVIRNFTLKRGPWVVRPDYTITGKRSIALCSSKFQLEKAVKNATLSSRNSRADVALFKEGKDITTLFVIERGEPHFLVAWQEKNCFRDDNSSAFSLQARALKAPFYLDDSLAKEVNEYARSFATRFPDVVHLVAISWRLQNNKQLFLIEIHVDLTGDRILDELLPGAFGREIITPVANWLVEKTPEALDSLVNLFNERSMEKIIEFPSPDNEADN